MKNAQSKPGEQGRDGPSRRVTMRDVAELAGVSPAAVSLALSGRGRIGQETRQRILKAAAKLNYELPRNTRSASFQRVFTVQPGRSRRRLSPVVDVDVQLQLLQLELDQRRQEGCDVTEIEPLVQELRQGRATMRAIEALQGRLARLELQPGYAYREPSDWEGIAAERPVSLELETGFSSEQLYDRIYGGWLGRCIGCTLGRPLEIGATFEELEEFLRSGNAYPLDDYVPEILPHPELYTQCPDMRHFLRGHIRYAPRDDDLDYTILNLLVMEEYGLEFTSEQVAQLWLECLTFDAVYTAERVAYANLVNQYGPPDTAIHRNAFREFIGAQIRADVFGYTAPGLPDLAAQRAWRDGRISHVKNGIYGEMMVSAMIAAAFVVPDVETIVQAGLSVIPARSRMAVAVQEVMKQTQQASAWQDVAAYVMERFAGHDPIHVLPNACLVVLALLWGQGDFERSITTAAMCGLDTDCNAATVGSIIGVLDGASGLPGKWKDPLNDRLVSWVRGYNDNRISDLARRTLDIARGSFSVRTGEERFLSGLYGAVQVGR
jgi:transcriptional regulator with XRE-family HTH domain